MCRWLVVLSWFLGVCSSVVAAPVQIHLQSHRTEHPEYQWLQRFLRMRGYQIVQRQGADSLLRLDIQTERIVSLRQGRFGRKYRLPALMHSPVLRARMYMMCVDLFLEALRHQSTEPPAVQSRPMDVSLSSVVRPSIRPLPETSPRHRRASAMERRLSVLLIRRRQRARATLERTRLERRRTRGHQATDASTRPARQPVPSKPMPPRPRRWIVLEGTQPAPATAPQVPAVRWIVLDKSPSPPGKRLSPPPTKGHPARPLRALNTRARKVKRRAQVPKATAPVSSRPIARTVALGVSQPIVPSRRIWGDLLSLDLGLAGGLRWGSRDYFFWGGRLLVGLNIGRFGFYTELSIHTDFFSAKQVYIPVVTPSFMLGWWIPLGAAERWFALSIRLGIETEAFVNEYTYTEASKVPTNVTPKTKTVLSTPLQLGIAAGLQIHGRLSKRWSLFVRPMLVIYPSGFQLSTDPNNKTSLSPLQVSAILGLQVRL